MIERQYIAALVASFAVGALLSGVVVYFFTNF